MVFLSLLLCTFLISTAVCFVVQRLFKKPIASILKRILSDPISNAWARYMTFAIYVTGIASGVNLYKIEKYITPPNREGATTTELIGSRWILEIYRTIIETLQGIAWMLLFFFIVALILFVLVRIFETIKEYKLSKPPVKPEGS